MAIIFWNSGIFVLSAKSFKKELEEHVERMAEQFAEGNKLYYTEKEPEFIQRIYTVVKSIAIDVAIMEKSKNILVIPSDFGWTDLGTWNSLYEQVEKDKNANVIFGKVKAFDSKNCVIHISEDKTLIVQGLENMIVAEKNNKILICSKDQEQNVKKYIESLD